jgi:hypothetical protein
MKKLWIAFKNEVCFTFFANQFPFGAYLIDNIE